MIGSADDKVACSIHLANHCLYVKCCPSSYFFGKPATSLVGFSDFVSDTFAYRHSHTATGPRNQSDASNASTALCCGQKGAMTSDGNILLTPSSGDRRRNKLATPCRCEKAIGLVNRASYFWKATHVAASTPERSPFSASPQQNRPGFPPPRMILARRPGLELAGRPSFSSFVTCSESSVDCTTTIQA